MNNFDADLEGLIRFNQNFFCQIVELNDKLVIIFAHSERNIVCRIIQLIDNNYNVIFLLSVLQHFFLVVVEVGALVQ